MSDAPPENAPLNLPALLDAGRYDDVMVQVILAIQAGDLHPNMLSLLAGVMLNTGWAATPVVAILEKALETSPDDSLLLLNLALIFYPSDSARASHYLQRFFAATPGPYPDGGSVRVVRASPVVPFDEWRHGQDVRELEPAEVITVADPYDGVSYSYQSPPLLMAKIPTATIIPGWDFVVLISGEVLDGSGYMGVDVRFNGVSALYSKEAGRVVHPWPRPLVVVDADALFLSAPNGNHFGHWIGDFLPRLYALRNAGALKIAVPSDITQHQRDTLFAFVRPEDVIWCEMGRRYRFRSLTVVRHGGYYRPNTAISKFLYDGLGPDPAAAPKKPELGRRVFLERSGTARGRAVANHAELDSLLDDLEFERMRRPEVSVPRQNEILREAGIVMTAYGSDAWALYQLRPGTDLVVFYFADMRELDVPSGTLAIAGHCARLGIRLHRVLCRGAVGTGQKQGYKRDIVVNCTALQDLLYGIIERRSLAYAESWGSTT